MAQRIRTLTTLPKNPSLIIRTYMAAPQLSATANLEVIQHLYLTLVGKRHTFSTKIYVPAKHLHKINKTIPQFLQLITLLALSIKIKINLYMALQERHAHVHLKYQHRGKKILNSMPAKTIYHIKKGVLSHKRHSLKKYQARYDST